MLSRQNLLRCQRRTLEGFGSRSAGRTRLAHGFTRSSGNPLALGVDVGIETTTFGILREIGVVTALLHLAFRHLGGVDGTHAPA